MFLSELIGQAISFRGGDYTIGDVVFDADGAALAQLILFDEEGEYAVSAEDVVGYAPCKLRSDAVFLPPNPRNNPLQTELIGESGKKLGAIRDLELKNNVVKRVVLTKVLPLGKARLLTDGARTVLIRPKKSHPAEPTASDEVSPIPQASPTDAAATVEDDYEPAVAANDTQESDTVTANDSQDVSDTVTINDTQESDTVTINDSQDVSDTVTASASQDISGTATANTSQGSDTVTASASQGSNTASANDSQDVSDTVTANASQDISGTATVNASQGSVTATDFEKSKTENIPSRTNVSFPVAAVPVATENDAASAVEATVPEAENPTADEPLRGGQPKAETDCGRNLSAAASETAPQEVGITGARHPIAPTRVAAIPNQAPAAQDATATEENPIGQHASPARTDVDTAAKDSSDKQNKNASGIAEPAIAQTELPAHEEQTPATVRASLSASQPIQSVERMETAAAEQGISLPYRSVAETLRAEENDYAETNGETRAQEASFPSASPSAESVSDTAARTSETTDGASEHSRSRLDDDAQSAATSVTSDPDLAATEVSLPEHIPARIIADYAFLLGRVVTGDITDAGQTVISKGELILTRTVDVARRHAKLFDLTVKSRS